MREKQSVWPLIISAPSEGLRFETYIHQIMNFRYHWHEDMYEISIILHGHARSYAGDKTFDLYEDDLFLVNPFVGHASLALEPGTIAIVFRFSYDYTSRQVRKGTFPLFQQFHTDASDRDDSLYRNIRCYAADTLLAPDLWTAKLNAALLMQHLLSDVPHTGKRIPESHNKDDGSKLIIDYINDHYFEKLRLEDLASFTGYNRTYLSSFFPEHIGIGFHDYLSRIRFQNALKELYYTDKPLTDIALGNGFPELKSFTSTFKEMLGMTPSEYIATRRRDNTAPRYFSRQYLEPDQSPVREKLKAYNHKGI